MYKFWVVPQNPFVDVLTTIKVFDQIVLSVQFAEALAEYVQRENLQHMRVWTSLLKRTIQTANPINAPKEHWKALNEIDAVCVFLYSSCVSVNF